MGTSGDYLLIRTCREMYNGHQTNLTIQLNMETMQASFNVPGYASHSLNQFIKVDKDNKIASGIYMFGIIPQFCIFSVCPY